MIYYVCRILSAAVGLLPGLDLPRRAVLHREHNALVHHKRGPLPESALPNEVRAQQDQTKGNLQDYHRVAPQHRHEFAPELNVLQGKLVYSLYTRCPQKRTRVTKQVAEQSTVKVQFCDSPSPDLLYSKRGSSLNIRGSSIRVAFAAANPTCARPSR